MSLFKKGDLVLCSKELGLKKNEDGSFSENIVTFIGTVLQYRKSTKFYEVDIRYGSHKNIGLFEWFYFENVESLTDKWFIRKKDFPKTTHKVRTTARLFSTNKFQSVAESLLECDIFTTKEMAKQVYENSKLPFKKKYCVSKMRPSLIRMIIADFDSDSDLKLNFKNLMLFERFVNDFKPYSEKLKEFCGLSLNVVLKVFDNSKCKIIIEFSNTNQIDKHFELTKSLLLDYNTQTLENIYFYFAMEFCNSFSFLSYLLKYEYFCKFLQYLSDNDKYENTFVIPTEVEFQSAKSEGLKKGLVFFRKKYNSYFKLYIQNNLSLLPTINEYDNELVD